MITHDPTPRPSAATRERARRMPTAGPDGAALLADWRDMVFIHFALPPETLQPQIPFPLDLLAGRAWVSLAIFTQQRLRPRHGGSLAAWLLRPIAHHRFCNLRTYVRVRGEAGIHFITEWIDNTLAVLLGPRSFGLPYRPAQLDLDHADPAQVHGTVMGASGERLAYAATGPRRYRQARQRHERFLIERYAAFTGERGQRLFRITHAHWPLCPLFVEMQQRDLIDQTLPALRGVPPACAHHSPGVFDVRIGPPLGAARAGKR
jgi:uncharacterized protein YqjF (DUF2071 family)